MRKHCTLFFFYKNKHCTSWPPALLWSWIFFPKLSMDFPRNISSFSVLLIRTVFSGHSPFLSHIWVIAFGSFLVYVELTFGIKLGLVYMQKHPVQHMIIYACLNIERSKIKANLDGVVFKKRMIKSWLKSYRNTSILSPSSLCKKILISQRVELWCKWISLYIIAYLETNRWLLCKTLHFMSCTY